MKKTKLDVTSSPFGPVLVSFQVAEADVEDGRENEGEERHGKATHQVENGAKVLDGQADEHTKQHQRRPRHTPSPSEPSSQ